jgi:hypothetical protein
MKFSTPIGALSGNSVQVKFPAVVWMIAVGGPDAECVAALAAPADFAVELDLVPDD